MKAYPVRDVLGHKDTCWESNLTEAGWNELPEADKFLDVNEIMVATAPALPGVDSFPVFSNEVRLQ